jgi:hypothetical protein
MEATIQKLTNGWILVSKHTAKSVLNTLSPLKRPEIVCRMCPVQVCPSVYKLGTNQRQDADSSQLFEGVAYVSSCHLHDGRPENDGTDIMMMEHTLIETDLCQFYEAFRFFECIP